MKECDVGDGQTDSLSCSASENEPRGPVAISVCSALLAVPVLVGSCAYAIFEAASRRDASLSKEVNSARRFYGVIGVSVLVGLALNYARLKAVRMLFWSAVLNGILAPPLVILVLLLTSDHTVMGKRANAPGAKVLGWACATAMAAAAVALFVL